jgi:hypothetical protein
MYLLKEFEKKGHYLCIKHLIITQYDNPLVVSTLIKLFVEMLKFSKSIFFKEHRNCERK